MNATAVMLAEPATAHGASMVDENVPDAPPSPSSDYSRVIEALAGSARTPYMLTIPAQLAAMLPVLPGLTIEVIQGEILQLPAIE